MSCVCQLLNKRIHDDDYDDDATVVNVSGCYCQLSLDIFMFHSRKPRFKADWLMKLAITKYDISNIVITLQS